MREKKQKTSSQRGQLGQGHQESLGAGARCPLSLWAHFVAFSEVLLVQLKIHSFGA